MFASEIVFGTMEWICVVLVVSLLVFARTVSQVLAALADISVTIDSSSHKLADTVTKAFDALAADQHCTRCCAYTPDGELDESAVLSEALSAVDSVITPLERFHNFLEVTVALITRAGQEGRNKEALKLFYASVPSSECMSRISPEWLRIKFKALALGNRLQPAIDASPFIPSSVYDILAQHKEDSVLIQNALKTVELTLAKTTVN
jgi:hypothetical protein